MTPPGLQRLAKDNPERALELGLKWFGRKQMNESEIAECLGVSRGRVWQIKTEAISKIKEAIRKAIG